MLFYIIIASVIFWFGYLKNSKKRYMFSILLLFALTACRAWRLGGTDAQIYHSYFVNAISPDIFLTSDYGIAYTLLNYIIRLFTENYYVFQFIYAAISFFILHLVLNKLDISWSEKCVLLFSYFCLRFFYNEWIALRQNLANLLFWYFLICIYQCEKKKRIKQIVLIICAIAVPYMFHSSALLNIGLMFGVWGLSKLRMETKAILVPIVAFALRATGSRFLAPAITFMTSYISDRYEMYSGSGELGSNFIYFILRLMFFIFFCYRYYQDESKTRNAVFDIFGMMLMVAAIDLEIVSRVFEYYAIGLYAAIGTFLQSFNDRSKNLAALIFYICMIFILVHFLNSFTSPSFIPYQFWS